jgi:hypothetical protein
LEPHIEILAHLVKESKLNVFNSSPTLLLLNIEILLKFGFTVIPDKPGIVQSQKYNVNRLDQYEKVH